MLFQAKQNPKLSEQDKQHIVSLRNLEKAYKGGGWLNSHFQARPNLTKAAIARDIRKAIENGDTPIEAILMESLQNHNMYSFVFLTEETQKYLNNPNLFERLSNASQSSVILNDPYTYEGKTSPIKG